MGTIIFARHAESQANAAGLINADPRVRNPLSHRGIEQARRLSEALRDVPIDVCFTSQLLRAKQTAEIVMTGRGVDVIELPELNEPAAGDFEGGPVDTYNDWVVTRGYWAPNPGGESQVDALRRFMRAYWTILIHPSDWILIVAHALPIGWLREGIRPLTRLWANRSSTHWGHSPLGSTSTPHARVSSATISENRVARLDARGVRARGHL